MSIFRKLAIMAYKDPRITGARTKPLVLLARSSTTRESIDSTVLLAVFSELPDGTLINLRKKYRDNRYMWFDDKHGV